MNALKLVSPLRYPGAKQTLAPWIVSNLPAHRTYVEPFFGSGAVLFNKEPSKLEYANDLDGDVVNFFRVCRERPDELARALEFTPNSREELRLACEPSDCELERARRLAVRCWQSRAHTYSLNNASWRHSGAKTPNSTITTWLSVPDRIRAAAERLRVVQIECRPAGDVIARLDDEQTLFYVDPPYEPSTRAGRIYREEMMQEVQHVELLTQLLGLKGKVVLSGYHCELYDDMLSGWRAVNISTLNAAGGAATEALWLNPAATKTTPPADRQGLTPLWGPQ